MSGKWKDSKRRQELPSNWETVRALVSNRAHGQCEWTLPSGNRCPRHGTDCDHKEGKHVNDWRKMRWLCADHHKQATQRQAQAAKKAKHAKREPRHPGDLT